MRHFKNAGDAQFTQSQTSISWWRIFNDAQLAQLIHDAATANHDLRIAAANLRQARALLLEARYDYYPTVTASGGYDRQRFSKATVVGVDPDRDLFSAGFDATWELDLFGRVRRSVEARKAEVEAAQASQEDVLISVFAEVARNYFELRGAQDRLAVARRNAQNQSDTYKLTVNLLNGGRGNELDLRAKARLNQRSLNSALESGVEQIIYRLSVLTAPTGAAQVGLSQPVACRNCRPRSPLAVRPIFSVGVLMSELPAESAAAVAASARTADLYPHHLRRSLGCGESVPDMFRGGG
jgi:multidrug efflux system outer membrane protein